MREPDRKEADRSDYDPDNPWNRYEIKQLGLKLSGAVRASIIHGSRLYCITLGRSGSLTLSTHRFPEGGPALRTESLALESTRGRLSPALIGDQLFIGTESGLVTQTPDGKFQLLTEEDGLPGTVIRAVAAYDDRLYLGLGGENRRGFGVFDPAARTGRIIFSSTAVEADRRRDIAISRIIHDDERDCLWLLGGGLYRYDPPSDQLSPRIGSISVHSGRSGEVVFGSNGLILGGNNILLFSLDTFEETQLVKAAWSSGTAVLGTALQDTVSGRFFLMSPIWYDGTALIAHTRIWDSEGRPVPVLVKYREEEHALIESPQLYQLHRGPFHDTPHGLFVFDNKGEGYLIRKTGD